MEPRCTVLLLTVVQVSFFESDAPDADTPSGAVGVQAPGRGDFMSNRQPAQHEAQPRGWPESTWRRLGRLLLRFLELCGVLLAGAVAYTAYAQYSVQVRVGAGVIAALATASAIVTLKEHYRGGRDPASP